MNAELEPLSLLAGRKKVLETDGDGKSTYRIETTSTKQFLQSRAHTHNQQLVAMFRSVVSVLQAYQRLSMVVVTLSVMFYYRCKVVEASILFAIDQVVGCRMRNFP